MAKQRDPEESTERVTASEDVPRISIIDRRLQHPFGTPSREIPLIGAKSTWVVRTFCADPEHPNRHYDAVHRLGWIAIKESDLAVSPQSLGFTVAPDKRIVRGPGGNEVLMGMPRHEFEKIQASKSAANLASIKGPKVRDEVAQATADQHGSEAGDVVHKHFTQREIVEPIQAGE